MRMHVWATIVLMPLPDSPCRGPRLVSSARTDRTSCNGCERCIIYGHDHLGSGNVLRNLSLELGVTRDELADAGGRFF